MFCRDFSFAYSIKYIHTEPQFCGFKIHDTVCPI